MLVLLELGDDCRFSRSTVACHQVEKGCVETRPARIECGADQSAGARTDDQSRWATKQADEASW